MDLVITRGLPGSGKSTRARAWQAQDAPSWRVYVDRDDLRMMMFGRSGLLSGPEEDVVTLIQHAAIQTALAAARSVIVADTFLRDDRLDPVVSIGATYGARVWYIDLRNVPVETCIERDAARGAAGGRTVGADIIRIMAKRYGLENA